MGVQTPILIRYDWKTRVVSKPLNNHGLDGPLKGHDSNCTKLDAYFEDHPTY